MVLQHFLVPGIGLRRRDAALGVERGDLEQRLERHVAHMGARRRQRRKRRLVGARHVLVEPLHDEAR
jgi:hypothetical protein